MLNDLTKRQIGNIVLIATFIITISISDFMLTNKILVLLLVSTLSVLLFFVNFWAGGDGKLLIVLAPLFPPYQVIDLIVSILLCGGLLSLFYYLKYRVFFKHRMDRGLPYSVAIIIGAHLSLYFSQGLTIYS
ncbi:prepilin peptidase [Vibrio rarus]